MTGARPRVTPVMVARAIDELKAHGFKVVPHGESRHLLAGTVIMSGREVVELAKFAWTRCTRANRNAVERVRGPKPRRAALVEMARQFQASTPL